MALHHRNIAMGAIGYFLCAAIITVTLYLMTGLAGVWFWLAGCGAGAVLLVIQSQMLRRARLQPRTEALTQIAVVLTMGLYWTIAPLVYMNDIATALLISSISAGLVAGALTMLSPCLPVYLVFLFPIALSVALKYLFLGGVLFVGLGMAALLYIIFLTVTAYHLELMMKESIDLRFENVDLIEHLRKAVAGASEANRAKSVFMASASHDLRQPLHAQGLFLEMLQKMPMNGTQENLLSQIIASSDAARSMLDSLLDFSKLDAGVIEPHPAPVRLQPLLNKLENELGPLADTKELYYRTRDTTVMVLADIALVELVLRNLISNAIRYTETGGILVACRRRGDQCVLEVWDTGIGIEAAEIKNIFKEFHQLANPERDNTLGFGLGLSIVDGLVKRMGVRLTVSSRPGRGSVFRLWLPQTRAPVVIQDSAPMAHPPSFNGQRVIVIDDDPMILHAMEDLLTYWGCHCLVAECCDDALQLLKASAIVPDLVITDYRLGQSETGRQAIIRLNAFFGKTLPAIIITGDTAPDRLREAQASAALLLHKPVSTRELKRAMEGMLTGTPAGEPVQA
ncbi:MAG: hybrid sensor histidine kinase/response regulator [Ketobacteraceae bacterium]|nr:hybrid sensor histidine kinase/response regulator [Ketobacteraceae bacterium]